MLKVYKRFAIIFLVECIFVLFCHWQTASLIGKSGPFSCAVYDSGGTLLGASVAQDGQWRFERGNVPPKFEKAIVAFEDKRFFIHPGVDFASIARAFASNIRAGKIVSGGSTITMQTVRILEKNPRRTVLQKAKEAFIALIIECTLTKKQILSLYAANAPFGGNVIGLEAASWRYFNRPPESLTWAETATLAVLPNQPALVYPGANKEILQKKRDLLLKRLFRKKIIDEGTLALALEERIPEKPFALPAQAAHYLEFLKAQNPGRSKFYTNIDLDLQRNADRIVNKWHKEFLSKNIKNVCAIIIDNSTKKPVAYIGNVKGTKTSAVNLIQARRSSGSLLKPFLFAAMLDNGMVLPDQLVLDVPTRIGSYKPENNIPQYRGVIPAGEALSRSLNIPAVKSLSQYGITAFLEYLKQCGFTTLNRTADQYGLPLILGGGEITLNEAALAYCTMMNLACLEENTVAKTKYPTSPGACYLTLSALANGARPAEESQWKTYANSKKIAWKTGTSSGNRDAWAIGVTAKYTVGVWVGNGEGNGNKEIKSNTTSAPLLFDLFNSLPNSSWPAFPYDELEEVTVCKNSGYLAGPNCEDTKISYRPKNSPLGSCCPYCHIVTLTPDLKFSAGVRDMVGKYAGQMPVAKKWFVLPPSVEYWYTKHTLGYREIPPELSPEDPSNARDSALRSLSIVFPERGANIVIPVEIDGKKGAAVMLVAERNKECTVYWDIDGDYLGSTTGTHQMACNPTTGKHVLTVWDSAGRRDSTSFTVVDSGD
ncbi:MAG: penicillin-binding protein 1C [Treponema sp.]|nr:penicillin-binding protein 1C [Treponema sp.]